MFRVASGPWRATARPLQPGRWSAASARSDTGTCQEGKRRLFSPVVTSSGRHAHNPDGLDLGNGLICRAGGNQATITRFAAVRDGTSQTFAVGETVPEWCQHTWWYWFSATTATCAIPLNYKKQPDLQVSMEGDWWHKYSFLSQHAGGAHFAMVDGSVRFVSDSISRDVYRALATISAAESVPQF